MRAAELFRERFGGEPDGVWLAPGRANLMGEHTDYNDGYVLPFALSQGVTAAAARRDGPGSRRLTLCSRQEPGAAVEIALDGLAPGQVTGWAAYPAGVAWALEAAGDPVPGACVAIDSDLPAGAGLSSSAALECATALALTELAQAELAQTELAGLTVPRRDLAAIARRAENEFVGVPTGIMDQSASLLGQAGHALLLDCLTLDTSQVPLDPAAAGASLLLINTRAKHDLVDGVRPAAGRVRRGGPPSGISSLRSLTTPAEADRLADPVLRRRVRHVVADNQRVLDVVALLSAPLGTPVEIYRDIGQLLTESHASLRDDFEISWPEADAGVEAALAAGAFGARMMGGGFGGSVLALVPAAGGPVRDAITAAFARRAWSAPEFLDAVPSEGARRLTLQSWCDRARRLGVTVTPKEDQVPVRDEAAKLAGEIAELRHSIHREPEIGLDLPKTQAKVLDALDGLPLEISTGRGLSSVTAVLRGQGQGGLGGWHPSKQSPVVLLRGDMDALPVTEETGLPYASAVPGAMHACGHDLHTAMLAGAARLLSARQADLPGTVIFMFQPGEEGYAGARHMINEGVLDAAGQRPVAAYALHVTANKLPCGMFSTRPGPMRPPPTRSRSPCTGAAGTPPSRTGPRTRSRPPARWCSRCKRW